MTISKSTTFYINQINESKNDYKSFSQSNYLKEIVKREDEAIKSVLFSTYRFDLQYFQGTNICV